MHEVPCAWYSLHANAIPPVPLKDISSSYELIHRLLPHYSGMHSPKWRYALISSLSPLKVLPTIHYIPADHAIYHHPHVASTLGIHFRLPSDFPKAIITLRTLTSTQMRPDDDIDDIEEICRTDSYIRRYWLSWRGSADLRTGSRAASFTSRKQLTPFRWWRRSKSRIYGTLPCSLFLYLKRLTCWFTSPI